ncbi:MAG TPA: protocatechuate 3,4-dioxygenase subunit alpha [Myxococcales bacterium]|nr:protocatechuate 3,4-dioxygenase subunit alpha [Myxococcales bacterium]
MSAGGWTPSQTIGPYFRLGLDRPDWSDLTRDGPRGDKIAIEGRVLDGDGAPVDDAVLEIWQADAEGRYDHPDDGRPADARFPGFGRVMTDEAGRYRFVTVRPGRVPGSDGASQAPHVNLTIFARGLLKQLVTRIYFADEPSNQTDPVLAGIADPAARKSLLAVRDGEAYRFDVVLQGKGETAFFEL